MLISISGKLGHGKDTLGEMFIELAKQEQVAEPFVIKKFAGKLKEVAGLILGVNPEVFEDQEFKKEYMPEQWDYWHTHVVKKDDGLLLHLQGKYATRERAKAEAENKDGFARSNNAITGIGLERMTYRQFLQILGTDALRDHLHENIWVNALFSDYKPESNWIITDTRFVNELDRVKDLEGLTILVVDPRKPIPANQHSSETALDNEDFDIVLTNDGSLEDLLAKAITIFYEHVLRRAD